MPARDARTTCEERSTARDQRCDLHQTPGSQFRKTMFVYIHTLRPDLHLDQLFRLVCCSSRIKVILQYTVRRSRCPNVCFWKCLAGLQMFTEGFVDHCVLHAQTSKAPGCGGRSNVDPRSLCGPNYVVPSARVGSIPADYERGSHGKHSRVFVPSLICPGVLRMKI